MKRRTFLRAGLQWAPVAGLTGHFLPALAGTPGVDEPPLAGPARPLPPVEFHEHRLTNGLRLVVMPQTKLPLVSLSLHMRPGSWADPAGRSGLNSLLADMRTKGARVNGRSLGASALAQMAESLGGSLGGGGDGRGCQLGISVASRQLQAAAGLLADVARAPSFPEDEWALLRGQTADSLKFNLADPGALASLVARRVAWGDSVLGQVMTPASLERITRQDFIRQHRLQAQPETSTWVMAGDIRPEAALKLAESLFGSWRAGANRPTLRLPALPSQRPADTVLVNMPGAGQSMVMALAPAIAADSPLRRIAQVATAVLGSGYSSRLNKEIRVRRGLSYGAGASLELQPPGGWLMAQAQTDHRNAAEVARLMQASIRELADKPPEADELAARQATLVGNFGRQLETTAGLAGLALDRVARDLPLADLQKVAEEIQAVTPAQITDFARQRWAHARLRLVVVGDLDAAGPELNAIDRGAQVLQADQLKLDEALLGTTPAG